MQKILCTFPSSLLYGY